MIRFSAARRNSFLSHLILFSLWIILQLCCNVITTPFHPETKTWSIFPSIIIVDAASTASTPSTPSTPTPPTTTTSIPQTDDDQKKLSPKTTLPLSIRKQVRGTRTTGIGSRKVHKSIFVRGTKSKISKQNPHKLYIEMMETKLFFYMVESGKEKEAKAVSLSYDQGSTSTNQAIQIQMETKRQFKKVKPDQRIEMEGIYGVYMLPSGPHIVLIYETEETYSSPLKTTNTSEEMPLLELRKVLKMEIVRIPPTTGKKGSGKPLTVIQRKEEERQLKLLRASFREHSLYYTPLYRNVIKSQTDGSVVHEDVTHNLQRTFLLHKALTRSNSTDELEVEHENMTKIESINVTEDKNIIDIQRKKNEVKDSSFKKKNHLWSRSDPRFFWNVDLIRPLLPGTSSSDSKNDKTQAHELLLHWIIPCTSAFVGIRPSIPITTGINTNTTYDLLLISRRSKFRAGTRFTMRGADATGSVANYAETEQIVMINDDTNEIYSHVQTRGSIPLRWSSPADVKTYAPRVRIGLDPLSQARALRRHLVAQLCLYSHSVPDKKEPIFKRGSGKSELVFCNLVDKKGDQGRLGRAFDSVLKAVLDVYKDEPIFSYGVDHIWYDFHAECKGGKWYKLKSLLEQMRPSLEAHEYFSARGSKICSLQRGTIRTNCMDCLDRTNVVQSLFARYIIFHQFKNRFARKKWSGRTIPLEYVVGYRKEPLSLPWKQGEVSHRALWADNADTISNLYAGTNALKGDFTRTGQRTRKGMIDDGVNSITRYYLNNFADAMRQEGYDLMTGCEPFSFVNYDSDKRDVPDNLNGVKKDKELHLRWLPGDLKSHTISETMATEDGEDSFDDEDDITAPSPLESAALYSIDHRAASDRPWWAMEEDEAIVEEEFPDPIIPKAINTQISTTGRTGAISIIGAVLAAYNAPLATAAMIMFVLGPGLFSLAKSEKLQ